MAEMSYHIDIHYLFPREMFADPGQAEVLKLAGIRQEAEGNTVALFRDPRMVAAVAALPEEVRAAFERAGFGVQASGQRGDPTGFDVAEDSHRMKKAGKLLEEMKALGHVATRFPGGFDMRLFMAQECRMQIVAARKQSGEGEAGLIEVLEDTIQDLERAAATDGEAAPRPPAQPQAQEFERPEMPSAARKTERPDRRLHPVLKGGLVVLILGLPFYGGAVEGMLRSLDLLPGEQMVGLTR